MQFKTIVRSEHLNHHGVLFGGYLLLWVDEFAYIAALEDFPGVRFVTRGMEAASFTQSVQNGAILTFDVTQKKKGRTSVTYGIDIAARNVDSLECRPVFQTQITFCAVDEEGRKTALPEFPQKTDSSCRTCQG